VFTLGMVTTDALNGLWVARMMAAADGRAAAASRWMSAAVAGLCLLIAALTLARQLLPGLDERADAISPALSVGTLLVILGVAVLASRSASRRRCSA
jgi:high-affinity nickel-transport protein